MPRNVVQGLLQCGMSAEEVYLISIGIVVGAKNPKLLENITDIEHLRKNLEEGEALLGRSLVRFIEEGE